MEDINRLIYNDIIGLKYVIIKSMYVFIYNKHAVAKNK